MTEPILAWHFLRAGSIMRDGRVAPDDGVPLVHSGTIEPCVSGLHASIDIIDAILYAPGPILCRVECRGDVIKEPDKLACRERVVLWRIDAAPVLRACARWCALQVADLWACPGAVRAFLETGGGLEAALDAAISADVTAASGADHGHSASAARAALHAAYAAGDTADAAVYTGNAFLYAASAYSNAVYAERGAPAAATRNAFLDALRTKLLEMIEEHRSKS